MGIGQVILGVQDLDAAASRFESLGLAVVDGGVHPGLGTANRVVPLGSSYLELLGVVDRSLAAESAVIPRNTVLPRSSSRCRSISIAEIVGIVPGCK